MKRIYKIALLVGALSCLNSYAMEEGVLFKDYPDLPDVPKDNVFKQHCKGMPIKDAIKRVCKLRQVSKAFKETLYMKGFLKEVFYSCV